MSLVPNQPPETPGARRLAICGESPGADEVDWHVCQECGEGYSPKKTFTAGRCPRCRGVAAHQPSPFVGPSGKLLNLLLAEVGIRREQCWVGNVCQVQPPGNKIELFKWDGEEIQSGLRQLHADLAAFQPHMILALGNTPLRGLTGDRKRNIGDWRGSLFLSNFGGVVKDARLNPGGPQTLVTPEPANSDHAGSSPATPTLIKCLATYHPAALLREASLTAATRFDMRRLAEELPKDGLELPVRQIEVDLELDELLDRLETARKARSLLSVDLEGVVDYIECIGFAAEASRAFVVPFIHVDGSSVWEEDEEYALWQAIGDLLEDPAVPKVLQNGLYDAFVLAWSLGILVRNIADDTMLKHHEIYCELEKSLGFQASIYTREPFYKFQRKASKQLEKKGKEE